MRFFPTGRNGFAGVAAVGCAIVAVGALAATPDEIVSARRAGFKHVGEVAKAMKEGVESGADVTPFAAGAGDIAAWAVKIPTLFPPGTETVGGTHALPPVWADRAGFDKLANDLAVQAAKLQTVAATGDKAAFLTQFKATGAVCGECHHTYRAKL
jgi:cytochrome c556